eukprot:scaffold298550_cov18-Tisochrysis_lutea.AAC.1
MPLGAMLLAAAAAAGDLKPALARAINLILQPVRDHFANDPEAKELLKKVGVTPYMSTNVPASCMSANGTQHKCIHHWPACPLLQGYQVVPLPSLLLYLGWWSCNRMCAPSAKAVLHALQWLVDSRNGHCCNHSSEAHGSPGIVPVLACGNGSQRIHIVTYCDLCKPQFQLIAALL